MGERIEIKIDAEEIARALQMIDGKIDETEDKAERVIDGVNKATTDAYMRVLHMARNSYLIGLGLVKASGATVSYFFRSMMSAAFSTIAVLTPLVTAMLHTGIATMNPFMVAEAIIALSSLGVSIAAVVAAEAEREDLARSLRGLDMTLLGIGNMISGMYFL